MLTAAGVFAVAPGASTVELEASMAISGDFTEVLAGTVVSLVVASGSSPIMDTAVTTVPAAMCMAIPHTPPTAVTPVTATGFTGALAVPPYGNSGFGQTR